MATLTLHNTFHKRSVNVRPSSDGIISHAVYLRVMRELCGSQYCHCGGLRDERFLLEPAVYHRFTEKISH